MNNHDQYLNKLDTVDRYAGYVNLIRQCTLQLNGEVHWLDFI